MSTSTHNAWHDYGRTRARDNHHTNKVPATPVTLLGLYSILAGFFMCLVVHAEIHPYGILCTWQTELRQPRVLLLASNYGYVEKVVLAKEPDTGIVSINNFMYEIEAEMSNTWYYDFDQTYCYAYVVGYYLESGYASNTGAGGVRRKMRTSSAIRIPLEFERTIVRSIVVPVPDDNSDEDNDGVSYLDEIKNRTSPVISDTDCDRMNDDKDIRGVLITLCFGGWTTNISYLSINKGTTETQKARRIFSGQFRKLSCDQ